MCIVNKDSYTKEVGEQGYVGGAGVSCYLVIQVWCHKVV